MAHAGGLEQCERLAGIDRGDLLPVSDQGELLDAEQIGDLLELERLFAGNHRALVDEDNRVLHLPAHRFEARTVRVVQEMLVAQE